MQGFGQAPNSPIPGSGFKALIMRELKVFPCKLGSDPSVIAEHDAGSDPLNLGRFKKGRCPLYPRGDSGSLKNHPKMAGALPAILCYYSNVFGVLVQQCPLGIAFIYSQRRLFAAACCVCFTTKCLFTAIALSTARSAFYCSTLVRLIAARSAFTVSPTSPGSPC
jgi:hypothetical protein